MKILITGGAGFIASHITDAYINLGHQVMVFDNLSSGKKEFINKKAQSVVADITDKNTISQIINDFKPEVINHHAAQISVRNSVENPVYDATTNIIGLLNLLEAGKKAGIKKVIFASSGGAIYGEAKDVPTKETYQPLIPLSPYGVAKLASEYYLNYYYQVHKVPFIALRYSNVYGPRQNPHGEAGVVAIFSKRILKKEPPVINGDGMQTRDYIFSGDIVEANIAALNSNSVGSYNIGTGRETNVVEVFDSLQKLSGIRIKPLFGPAKEGEQKRSSLDTSLAKSVLGWKAKTDIKTGLEITLNYFQTHE